MERTIAGKTYKRAGRGARAGRWYEVRPGQAPRWLSRDAEANLGLNTSGTSTRRTSARSTASTASTARREKVKVEVRPRVSTRDGEKVPTSRLPKNVQRAAAAAREECGEACQGMPITLYYYKRRGAR